MEGAGWGNPRSRNTGTESQKDGAVLLLFSSEPNQNIVKLHNTEDVINNVNINPAITVLRGKPHSHYSVPS